jgi:hypothetical protein
MYVIELESMYVEGVPEGQVSVRTGSGLLRVDMDARYIDTYSQIELPIVVK